MPGDSAHGEAGGSVAECGVLSRRPQHGQHEHPGTDSGLWTLRFYGQVDWIRSVVNYMKLLVIHFCFLTATGRHGLDFQGGGSIEHYININV